MKTYRILAWPLAILVIGFIYSAAKEEATVSPKIPEATETRIEQQSMRNDFPTALQQKQDYSQQDASQDLATQALSSGLDQARQADLDDYHDTLQQTVESPLPRVIVAGTPLENMPQLSLGDAR